MSGSVNSAKGFLGLGGGPTTQGGGTYSSDELDKQNDWQRDSGVNNALASYGQGGGSSQDVLNAGAGLSPIAQAGLEDQLATGAMTGSRFATDQVMSNPMFSSMFGSNGLMQNEANQLNGQVNQGMSLQPEDNTLYGQEAGNIARQYGQQGNQTASDLASRGLSSSGAAGATFSGLAGNQNEMLQQAQQQIVQQRFSNTMNQMNQLNQMAGTAGNLVNQQYGRQLSGAQEKTGSEQAGAQAGLGVAQSNLGAANFNAANQPQNFFDMAQAGLGSAIGAGGKQAGSNAGNSMFNSTSTAKPGTAGTPSVMGAG